jgi:hypothetical protein
MQMRGNHLIALRNRLKNELRAQHQLPNELSRETNHRANHRKGHKLSRETFQKWTINLRILNLIGKSFSKSEWIYSVSSRAIGVPINISFRNWQYQDWCDNGTIVPQGLWCITAFIEKQHCVCLVWPQYICKLIEGRQSIKTRGRTDKGFSSHESLAPVLSMEQIRENLRKPHVTERDIRALLNAAEVSLIWHKSHQMCFMQQCFC